MARQADGKIIIGGGFGSVSGIARSCIARLNPDGTLDTAFDPGASARVRALAIQEDGAIVVGGDFIRLGGGGGATSARASIGRLLPNGDLDISFNPGTDGSVYAVAVQPDGKILVGGAFARLAGTSCNNIGRLNPDGSFDATFSPIGTDTTVHSIALQPNGKIVLGGEFLSVGDQAFNYLGRLETNGTPDMTFSNSSPDGLVASLALDVGSRIIIGGQFLNLGGSPSGSPHNYVARLNTDGSPDASFVDPGADGFVDAVAFQADGKILLGGEFLNLSGQAHAYIGRLNADSTVDDGFNPSVSGSVYAQLVQPDQSIVFGGMFTSVNGQTRSFLARLYPDSSLDATLNPGLQGGVAVTGVYGLAMQPDGRILVGGNFASIGEVVRANLSRLLPDGTVDAFNPGANGVVRCLAVQPDGRVLAGGNFSSLSGTACASLGRLNGDGSPDTLFNAGVSGSSQTVYALALQGDGKILIGGDFTAINGQASSCVGRLNSNGSIDSSFSATADGPVYAMALGADGSILLGGSFQNLNGSSRVGLGRLESDGSLDLSFTPIFSINSGSVTIQTIAVAPDGSVIVGGNFTQVNGRSCTNLCRLISTGALDDSFHPGVNGPPYTLSLQTDGKILIGGWFNILGGQLRNRIGRLNSDGTLDSGFDLSVGANNIVYSTLLQSDGKIVVGGIFSSVLGQSRSGLARIAGGGAVNETLTSQKGAVAWLRGGTAPEIQQTTIEQSFDGTNYTLLGNCSRINGGWQFTNLTVPSGENCFVRMRGRCGDGAGSSGIIERIYQVYNGQSLAAPLLTAASYQGAFSFSFFGPAGSSFSILASTNPALPTATWTLLGGASEINPGQFRFIDAQASNFPARYYRARHP